MEKRIPRVIRSEEGVKLETPGGGYGRRLLTTPVSEKMGMGILYVDKGKSPHRWHTHDKPDQGGSYSIQYPEGFEETYVIVQGEGVVQWKDGDKMHEEEVKTGDAVHFPAGVVEHQLLNSGDKPMIVVYAFAPSLASKAK